MRIPLGPLIPLIPSGESARVPFFHAAQTSLTSRRGRYFVTLAQSARAPYVLPRFDVARSWPGLRALERVRVVAVPAHVRHVHEKHVHDAHSFAVLYELLVPGGEFLGIAERVPVAQIPDEH